MVTHLNVHSGCDSWDERGAMAYFNPKPKPKPNPTSNPNPNPNPNPDPDPDPDHNPNPNPKPNPNPTLGAMAYFNDALPLTSAFLGSNPHVGAASREV